MCNTNLGAYDQGLSEIMRSNWHTVSAQLTIGMICFTELCSLLVIVLRDFNSKDTLAQVGEI